ncbi:unnamed protein product [Ostreobium quekettii]|uniref:non-specific serine/threonine protein kinase n=1 Tax=Ostreobium quekettii TaxID=121088 RepID=A0A8S1JE02_9CHLO|nr:unnamed protein product [Ostreobium quekettii]|eukprot:evm.model.scf_426.8 EVM.evm.TU.scf_426.8   scf_426:59826-65028(+)
MVAPLVGKVVQVGQHRLKVEAHLGEGGFASIYRVKEVTSGEMFALKHLRLGGKETVDLVRREAKVMNRLKGRPNILRLISVAFGGEVGAETDAYMLLDLCPDNLFRYLQRKEFKVSDGQLLEIFWAVCNAVAEMHSLEPPLTHRDVKVENVLRRPNKEWVLCDFGSSTSREQAYETPAEIGEEEENIRRHTTPAYRAPEMWDLYQAKRIDTRVDIWALGCVLFFLCYGKLPFNGDSKLQILNGNYQMPATRPAPIQSLIQDLLCVDPDHRPDIHTVLQRVSALQHYVHNAAGDPTLADPHNASFTSNPISMAADVAPAPPARPGSATGPGRLPAAQHPNWDQLNGRPEHLAGRTAHTGFERAANMSRQASTPQSGNPFATGGTIPTPDPGDTMSRQKSTPQLQGTTSWRVSHDNSCEYKMPQQQGSHAPPGVSRPADPPRSPGWADFDSPHGHRVDPQSMPQRASSPSASPSSEERMAEREVVARANVGRRSAEERQRESYQAPDRGSQAMESHRLRARELERENKALQGQVKQLQNVIASQQQTIQDLQQQNQRQQAQFEQVTAKYALEVQARPAQTSKRAAKNAALMTAPVSLDQYVEPRPWTEFPSASDEGHAGRRGAVGTSPQRGPSGGRLQEGTTRDVGPDPPSRPMRTNPQTSAARPANGTEKNGHGARVPPSGGKYWETQEGSSDRSNTAMWQVAAVGAADLEESDATHRRIVSDPPPLETWHLEGV